MLQLIGGNSTPDYKVTYYEAIPSLDVAPYDVNWLLQREPGAYLYASLLEASPYLHDNQQAVAWAAQYKDILEGMRREDDSARYGNAPSIQSPVRNCP